ncbi:MAG: methyltransferase domain-containing protein [Acidobacteriaceae bacterium]|nr:methyltransferase domain-containing protein [Acidobacteriaceae bacterium]
MHSTVLEKPSAKFDTQPPAAVNEVLGIIYGRFAGQAVCLAAKLGIADLIEGGVDSTQQLAASLGAQAHSLRRFLKALSSCQILHEAGQDRWELTDTGKLLRGDVHGSLRDLARLFATEEHTKSWLALEHAVLTGGPAFDHVWGKDAWAHAREHYEFNDVFNRAMSSIAGAVHQAIANVYDFSAVECLVDVGGGHGRLLSVILERFPDLRGIVYDMPHVAEGARAEIARRGLSERCEAVGGDFFASVPPADAYILTAVLHDWSDDECIAILKNCRRAVKPGGCVLMGDFILKPANEADFGRLIDLEMLVMTRSGCERTEEEFRALLGKADLRLACVYPLPSGNSLLEARPV